MCFVLIVFWNNHYMKERIYFFDKECGFEKKVRKIVEIFQRFCIFLCNRVVKCQLARIGQNL